MVSFLDVTVSISWWSLKINKLLPFARDGFCIRQNSKCCQSAVFVWFLKVKVGDNESPLTIICCLNSFVCLVWVTSSTTTAVIISFTLYLRVDSIRTLISRYVLCTSAHWYWCQVYVYWKWAIEALHQTPDEESLSVLSVTGAAWTETPVWFGDKYRYSLGKSFVMLALRGRVGLPLGRSTSMSVKT